MRILVTRPAKEGEHLAQLLRKRGHEAIVSPVIEISFEDGPELSLEGVQAILVTSANGARALARRTGKRDVALFAVGPQTTEAARSAGFTTVRNADGGSKSLIDQILQNAVPEAGSLIYATGEVPDHQITAMLPQAGFDIEVSNLYRTTEIASLSDAASVALSAREIDAVMLFSPRSARGFVQQVRLACLQEHCEQIAALCISDAVADALSPLRFAEIRIAARPNRENMVALLD